MVKAKEWIRNRKEAVVLVVILTSLFVFVGCSKANVVVDIGLGDREYYVFTNESGQTVDLIGMGIKRIWKK